jgi:hypothetical protein
MHVTFIENSSFPKAATIILQIHKDNKKNNPIHTIINIYRRPRIDPDFIPNMQLVIDNIYKKSPTTSITIHGDVNINLLNLKQPFYNFLLENSLYTTITTPRCHHTGTHTHRPDPHFEVLFHQPRRIQSTQVCKGDEVQIALRARFKHV